MKERNDFESNSAFYAAYATFGMGLARIIGNGTIFTDMHKGNLGILNNRIVLVDYADYLKISYPTDIEIVPKCLFSLLSWLDIETVSAFRFGFICESGSIGELIMGLSRKKYDFNAFDDLENIFYEINPEYNPINTNEELIEIESTWKLIKKIAEKGKSKDSYEPSELTRWRELREKDITLERLMADEFFLKRHLVSAVYHKSLGDLLESLINLQGLYTILDRNFESAAMSKYTNSLMKIYGISSPTDFIIGNFEKLDECLKKLDTHQLEALELIPLFPNIFRFFWAVEDCTVGKCYLKNNTVS
jgi:hypothetical protein